MKKKQSWAKKKLGKNCFTSCRDRKPSKTRYNKEESSLDLQFFDLKNHLFDPRILLFRVEMEGRRGYSVARWIAWGDGGVVVVVPSVEAGTNQDG